MTVEAIAVRGRVPSFGGRPSEECKLLDAAEAEPLVLGCASVRERT